MLGRLRNSLNEANYLTLVLEVFVVILGILIAFQIDRWTEQRRDRYAWWDTARGKLRYWLPFSSMKPTRIP